jgi:hypothetical protein
VTYWRSTNENFGLIIGCRREKLGEKSLVHISLHSLPLLARFIQNVVNVEAIWVAGLECIDLFAADNVSL